MTYLITFSCSGCHLHGSESGSVDRGHNAFRTPVLGVNSTRFAAESERMYQTPYNLDLVRRNAVLVAIREVCAHRGWAGVCWPPMGAPLTCMPWSKRRSRRNGLWAPSKPMRAGVWSGWGWMDPTGSDGRAMVARGGSGNPITSRRLFNMWSQSRVRPWPCSILTKRELREFPLPYGRGSESGSPNPPLLCRAPKRPHTGVATVYGGSASA